jgi:hypothetical protein
MVRQPATATLRSMPDSPRITTDADRRAYEAGRRAGLAVAAIVRQRAALRERIEPPRDEPADQA